MACLGSHSCGSRELEPCSSGELSMDRLDSGLQSMSRDTHCRSRNCCSGHSQPAPWNEVIWGSCMMCSPGQAGPQRGWNQMVSVNLEALTADDLMLSWPLVSYMTSRKVLSADWAVKGFQRGSGCTTCLEDVRTSAHQSCTCLMKGWGENPTESKRSLAATASSCNCQQASTAWKSALRRFSYSWGCATPSFLLCPELAVPCEKWTWKNSQKMAEIPPRSLNPVSYYHSPSPSQMFTSMFSCVSEHETFAQNSHIDCTCAFLYTATLNFHVQLASNTKDNNLQKKPPTGSSGWCLLMGSQQVWLPDFTPLWNFTV